MNAPSFAAKNLAPIDKLAGRILLIALLALVLSPLSAFAQSCPGSTQWNGGAGNWETAGDWSSGVPVATSNACINVANSTVTTTATSGDTTLNLDINLASDILNIGNNTQLTIASGGNILNNGAINLNSSGNNTFLNISGATTLSGTGTLTMSNSTANFITGGGTFTNGETIQGAGNIGNGSLTLVNNTGAIIDANVSSTLQINPNGGTTNKGTLEATAGGILELSGSTIANTGGLILATGTSGGMTPTPSVVELNNVSITGGTLTSSSGGVIESINASNQTGPTLTSVTITSGTNVDVPNNDILNLGAGTITNNGNINIQSSGNNTFLTIAGATTLSGTGTVTMSNSTANFIEGAGTLTNGETIQGGGVIGNGALTVINNGTIDANVSSALTLNASGGTTNNGTLEATASGVLLISGSTIANSSGLIEANAATVELNSVSITGGTLTTASGGVIESVNASNQTAPTLTNLTISTGSNVDVPNNDILSLGAGTITNNGNINLQSSVNNTILTIAGATTLSGTGTVTMSNSTANFIDGGGTLTNGETIQGGGVIGNGALTVINNGTIDANVSSALTLNASGGTTNNGTLEASASGVLLLSGSTIANSSGLIEANSATVELNSVSITGGTLTTTSGGVIESVNASNQTAPTLNGVTISTGSTVDIPNNDILSLAGTTVTNNGNINIQSSGNSTILTIPGSTTLSGTGTVTMSNSTDNFIDGGGTLTNNETIQGGGSIGNGNLTLINNGTIDANVSSPLTINPNGGTTNTKTLEATAGGTLILMTDAITNSAAGTILATGAGSTVELNNVSITGGTLTSSSGGLFESVNATNAGGPTLTSLTISAGTNVDIPNNDILNLGAGTITNNGTINLQSANNNTELLITGGNVTLTGGGNVTMSDNNANFIFAGTAGLTLTNVNNTISGSGNIGNGNMAFVNDAGGTVDATSAHGNVLTIVTGTNGATNLGLFEATAGGTLQLENALTNTGGTILATGAGATVELNSVSITGGTLTTTSGGVIESINASNATAPTLNGVTISTGSTVDIPNNDILSLAGTTVTNNGNINIQSSGNNTFLTIPGSTTLSGTGTVTMSNRTTNFVDGGGTLTNDETIQGGGSIGNGNLTLVNNGTIDANVSSPLTINPNGGTTNTKTLEATAGGTLILMTDAITNSAAGTILATGAGSTVELNNVSITGGTLTSSSGGLFESVNATNAGGPTLTSLTISAGTNVDIPNNDILTLGNGTTSTITNKGTINLQSGGNVTELVIDGNVTLAGTGKVVMSPNGNNFILGTGTLTNQNAIEGEGNIGDGQIGLVNTGSILANETGTHAPSTLLIDTGAGGFTNSSGTKNGILNVSAKNTLIIEGGPFTNFSAGTLTGGSYIVAGTLEFAAGTGLVTNDAAITLSSATAEIFNTTNSSNALTTFADNGTKGTFTVNGFTFTDANAFTNSGILAVGGGGKFNASTQLTNFNSTTSTLTGGTYNLTATGQLEFNNQGDSSDIVTNAAHITLSGVDTTKAPIIDQTGANALAGFNANASTGSFILSADRQFTTGGNLSNAGIVTVSKSTGTGTTELIVNGIYTQAAGTTTVDGVLNASGGINVSGGFIYGNAAGVTGGKQGTLVGNFDLTGGTLNPGDGIKKIGDLNITGTYTESGAGILNIDLDGTVANTKYDVLNVSGAAALGGTLNVDTLTGFTLAVGDSFDIMNYASETGTFTLNLPTLTGGDTWNVNYAGNGGTELILTVDGPAAVAAKGTVTASPAKRVTREMGSVASASNNHEPLAVLSLATCSAARMFVSMSCGDRAAAILSHSNELHSVASVGSGLGAVHNNVMAATTRPAAGAVHNNVMTASTGSAAGAVHNNVMVASRSMSSARGGSSNEPSASTSAMARLYVCAYLPTTLAHNMGCN